MILSLSSSFDLLSRLLYERTSSEGHQSWAPTCFFTSTAFLADSCRTAFRVQKCSFLIYYRMFYFDILFIELWVFCREKWLLIEVKFESTLVKIFSSSVEDTVMSVSMYFIRITCLSVEEKKTNHEASELLYQISKFLPNIADARVGCGLNNMRQAS